MVDWTSLTTPVEGGWQMGGAGTSAGLLAPNSGLYPYLGDIGAGLLAASGPSLAPQGGLGARLGGAMTYAGQRQGERILNDARRAEIARNTREEKGYAALADWAKKNPLLAADPASLKAAALSFAPELAAKSLLAGGMSPLETLLANQQLETARTTSQSNALALEQDYSALRTNYRQQDAALKALDTLDSIPGGSALLNSPAVVEAVTSGMGINEFTKKLAETGGSAVYGIPKADLPRVLSAAYTVNKAIKNISTNTQRAVASQASQAEGLGVGAPIDVRREIFKGLKDETERMLKTNPNWSIPETHRYEFEGPEKTQEAAAPTSPAAPAATPSIGYSSGAPGGGIVPQPASVYRPLPPPAAQAGAGPGAPTPLVPPAPAPRKVPTTVIDPATNAPAPTFPREADGRRGVPKGGLFLLPNPANPNDPFVYRNDNPL
jgi:hypothetical protein